MARFQKLLADAENGVLTLTLNRPDKRNALTPQLIDELIEALTEAEASAGVGAVVLTGAGAAFCAGLDLERLTSLTATTPEEHRRDSERMAALFRTLFDLPKPVVAAVNGPAIAAGMCLATIADFTLAIPQAKFGLNEVRVGYIPAIEVSFLLRQIGEKRTRELALSGHNIKAPEAHTLGLVTELVEPDELLPAAHALAQSLLLNSPQAMRGVKRLLAHHARHRLDEEIEAAIEANASQRATEDFREGVRAFLERRPAVWPSRHPKI